MWLELRVGVGGVCQELTREAQAEAISWKSLWPILKRFILYPKMEEIHQQV